MADHSDTPWRAGEYDDRPAVVVEDDIPILEATDGPTSIHEDRANVALVVRAVNAVTAPGPVDLDAALVLADEVGRRGTDRGTPEAEDVIRALAGEVARLRVALKGLRGH
jgi:hypothetical protein